MAKRKTHNDFCKEVYSIVDNEYSVIGNYVSSRQHIAIKHNICNTIWYITPDNFLRGYRCPSCQHRSYKKTTDEFKSEVYSIVGDEYIVLGEYVKNTKPIEIIHNVCGTIYKVTPNNFLSKNRRCPECANNKKRTKDQFILELKELGCDEYKLVGDFVNTTTKVLLKHKICGNIWNVSPNDFINSNSRCPYCQNNRSKGEQLIQKFFEDNGINYVVQKRFDDCKNIKYLPFDFYIQDYNCCIEYDGRQHYEPVDLFGGIEYYQYVKKNDQIKNE